LGRKRSDGYGIRQAIVKKKWLLRGNGAASNDCLPYENLRIISFIGYDSFPSLYPLFPLPSKSVTVNSFNTLKIARILIDFLPVSGYFNDRK
jgi:hypothetical protein